MSKRIRWLKKDVELLEEDIGQGRPIEAGDDLLVRMRMWLSRGEPITWEAGPSPVVAWVAASLFNLACHIEGHGDYRRAIPDGQNFRFRKRRTFGLLPIERDRHECRNEH